MLIEKITVAQLIEATQSNLETFNFSKWTINSYAFHWKQFAKFAEAKQAKFYTPELGQEFLIECMPYPCDKDNYHELSSHKRTKIRSIRFLDDFQQYGRIPSVMKFDKREYDEDFKKLLADFKEYSKSRQHTDGTIGTQMVAVNHFTSLFLLDKIKVSDITAHEISEYVAGLSNFAKFTVRARLCSLRFFFKFLYERGYHASDLSKAVPKARGARPTRVPDILTDEQLTRMLEAVDRGSPIGKRDYAVLLIAAQLGLRGSDIANLCFDNIDWDKRRIRLVQIKTQESLELPLLDDVAEAIIDYLKNGRPKADSPHIFIIHRAPYNKMTSFYSVADKYIRIAKIALPNNAPRGLHVLRHTLVNRLIRNGASLSDIADITGHKNKLSVKNYSHIDFEGLEKCALELNEVLGYAR